MIPSGKRKSLYKEGYIEDFYAIEEDEALGEGGSGIVRKAMRRETGETVAIKIIDKADMGESEQENLYNELNIMAIVDHPNIVRVHEYYENDGIVFIVMELMSGGELFDRIVQFEHYTEKQASEAFRPIVDAVRYCHSLGVVHRDLKPENLLYADNEENSLIKVSDFGLAKYMISKVENTPMYTACGTPSYVAPEIIGGKGYDFKVDCWSLGVILYVMLCGFPPFFDDDNEILFKLIQEGKYDFPSPYWDDVSDEAKDLVNKLLVTDHKDRLTTEEILKHPWLSGKTYSNKALQFDYLKYKAKICNNGQTHRQHVAKNHFQEEMGSLLTCCIPIDSDWKSQNLISSYKNRRFKRKCSKAKKRANSLSPKSKKMTSSEINRKIKKKYSWEPDMYEEEVLSTCHSTKENNKKKIALKNSDRFKEKIIVQ